MIVDTDGENCITAAFVFGGDSVEREYDIRVVQYETNNEMGGPPGCLQFLLGTVVAPHSGTITSFNFGIQESGQNQNSSLGTILRLMPCNISSVVEFQRWWVLKSKIFAMW